MCMRVLVRFSLPQLQHCWLRSNLHVRLAFYPTPIKSFQDFATLCQHLSFTAWHPTKTPYIYNPQAYRLLKQGQTDRTDGHWLTASDKPHADTFPIIQVIQYGVSAPSPGIIRTYIHTYIRDTACICAGL